MIIDLVDLEICDKIILNNYRIIQINYNEVLHKLGESEMKNLLIKKIVIHNESTIRLYYIFRNCIYMFKKYHDNHYLYLLLNNLFKSIIFERKKD